MMHFTESECGVVCEHIPLWSYRGCTGADTNRLSSFWHGFYSPSLFSTHIQPTLMPLLITWMHSSASSITLILGKFYTGVIIFHIEAEPSHCPGAVSQNTHAFKAQQINDSPQRQRIWPRIWRGTERLKERERERRERERERERGERESETIGRLGNTCWWYRVGGHSADSRDITHMRCMVTGSGGQGEEQTNTGYPRAVTFHSWSPQHFRAWFNLHLRCVFDDPIETF